MASLIDKLANVLMPEEEVEETERTRNTSEVCEKRAASISVPERPLLTVHTNPELKMMVYMPESFDQANIIANALKSKEAVIVNFERVSDKEQRRLCDFLNGVCYILDGGVQRVSEMIVLYVPTNVEINKELCAYSVPAYVKHSF